MTAIHSNGRVYGLTLTGADFHDRWIQRLSCFTGLRSLELYGTNVSEDGLFQLLTLSQLESIRLDGNRITDKTLDRLGKLSQLRELHIVYAQNVTDEAVRRLRIARPELMLTTERPPSVEQP